MTELIEYGTDSSGRKILMTPYMRDWWLRVVAALGFEPVITQGAWMKQAGGGAPASAGYHDGGGCLDLRVWNLTTAEQGKTIRTLRRMGAAAWVRDGVHGGFNDPHVHLVLGTDEGLTAGAKGQWLAYIAGRDGLASNGPDYHWRPDPLALVPPPARKPAPSIKGVRAWLRDKITTADERGYPGKASRWQRALDILRGR